MQRTAPTLPANVTATAFSDAQARVVETHAIVCMSTTDGELVYVNEKLCDVFGYAPDELIGSYFGVLDADVHDDAFFEHLRSEVNAGRSWVGETCNRTRDGRDIWFENIVVPVFGDSGAVTHHLSVRKDISERKGIEAQLQASEQFQLDVANVAKVGGWSLDLETNALHWSEETKRIHDVQQGYAPDVNKAIEFYAPEARAAITSAIEKGIAQGEAWDLELPLTTAKGRNIWVRAIGRAIYEHGRPKRLVGGFQEITERKHDEEMMREEVMQRHAAEQLLRDVLDSIPDAVAAYDADDRLIICNAAYLETYAISAEAIKPGAMFEDILRYGLARGQYADVEPDPEAQEAWLAARLKEHRNPPEHLTQKLRDGTWLQVRERRTEAGNIVGARTDVTTIKRAENELRRAAECDMLTGLLNRHTFSQRLTRALKDAGKGQPLHLCLFDLDHFKPINDSYGHDVGDEVLKAVAQRLSQVLGPDNFAARLGGDEFVFALLGHQARSEIEAKLDALFEALAVPIETRVSDLKVNMSLGIVEATDSMTIRDLMHAADLAQYEAKQKGRGRSYWFDAADAERASQQTSLAERFAKAIRQPDELIFALQPMVAYNASHSAEAGPLTVRTLMLSAETQWDCDGVTYGSQHIAQIASKANASAALCHRVMEEAMARLGAVAMRGAETGALWLTADGDHLRLRSFISHLETIRQKYELSPESIVVAVDEVTFSQRSSSAIFYTFQTLKNLGYRLGIDRFGLGGLPPTDLQAMGISVVRLDPSLTGRLAEETASPEEIAAAKAVRGLCLMAKALDLRVIANNVVSKAHGELLLQHGCDALQGPGILPPLQDSASLLDHLADHARRRLNALLQDRDQDVPAQSQGKI
ncbi:MAG: diguanylate cyclase [Pseudomonadota bacterium]